MQVEKQQRNLLNYRKFGSCIKLVKLLIMGHESGYPFLEISSKVIHQQVIHPISLISLPSFKAVALYIVFRYSASQWVDGAH